jgi:hypothetical protein
MYKNGKILITESDRNRIMGLYDRPVLSESVVISDWLSPDEKYCIFLDELYDIEKKQKLGNVWENFEHFKFFLKHSFEVAQNVPQEIKESVLTSLNSFVITESNQNMVGLKPYFKDYLINEGLGDWISGAGEWLKDTAKSTAQGVGDFLTKSYEGASKIISGISKGEWSEVLNLLKKGSLWVARKIRQALYSPVGLILDAILVATGIGKAAPFVLWGVVVALDIYELTTNNYENQDESFLTRLFFTGVDIIGMVFAGVAAKSARGLIGGVFRKFGTTTEGLTKAANSNSAFRGVLEKMLTSAQGASGVMGKVSSFLSKKSPMLFKFVSSIIGGLTKFVKKIIQTIGKILGAPGRTIEKTLGGGKLGKGAKAGAETSAIVGGLGTYGKTKEIQQSKELEKAFLSNNIKPDFGGI